MSAATPPPAQPRYSSPPAPRALATAPDGVVGAAGLRAAAAVGDYKGAPPGNPVGTVLYPGALVDPVSYSPLARALAAATGGAVVVPVFAGDLPADRTGERAAAAVSAASALPGAPERWLLAGHSMGGRAAAGALAASLVGRAGSLPEAQVAGIAIMASHVEEVDVESGMLPSAADLPALIIYGSEDAIVKPHDARKSMHVLPGGCAEICLRGGNHAFAHYDASGRAAALGDMWGTDGECPLGQEMQIALAAGAIAALAAKCVADAPQARAS